jgi:hypothetical protein
LLRAWRRDRRHDVDGRVVMVAITDAGRSRHADVVTDEV